MKKVTYISIKLDNVSTIIETGSLEMCMTQLSINSFNSFESVDFDECLQKTHCQKIKKIIPKTSLLVYRIGKIKIEGEISNKHCVNVSVL